MPKTPDPDEFGRYRVEQDTGTKFSLPASALRDEKVLDEPASDLAGDALPPEYPTKPLLSTTPSGPSADPKKESTHG